MPSPAAALHDLHVSVVQTAQTVSVHAPEQGQSRHNSNKHRCGIPSIVLKLGFHDPMMGP